MLAAEKDVSGRFILTNDESPDFQTLSRVMHELDPSVPAAPFVLPRFALGRVPFFDGVHAKRMGVARIATPEIAATMKKGVWKMDNTRARTVLGRAPAFTLKQSLADTMRALRELRQAEGKTGAA